MRYAALIAALVLFPISVFADVIADSVDDWSTTGTQGEKGWHQGYYNYTTDGNNRYSTGEFIPYSRAAHWTGNSWDLLAESRGPWTFSGPQDAHPNGTNSASPNGDQHEHWTVRRWVADRDVDGANITWHVSKSNTNGGNGVTGYLFYNGAELDREAIGGTDGVGTTNTLVRDVSTGDIIEVALSPVGPDGGRSDGSDGSVSRLTIDDNFFDEDDDGIPDSEDNCPSNANADQQNSDGDPLGDVCDNCPLVDNPAQRDRDRDGMGDECDDPEKPPEAYDVSINEIHYNPRESSELEFLELRNNRGEDLNIGGWAFSRGLRFEFPSGTEIPANGYLVVAKNPEILADTYGLDLGRVVWWTIGSLDNGGEKLTLVDNTDTLVDEVTYDDDLPWDTAADGEGPSLQRLCVSADSDNPANWAATDAPTPLADNATTQCPPPTLPAPSIAINEIHYHPANDSDAAHEYVELVNTTDATIDLEGYCFTQGIEFCFEGSYPLAGGDFVVVCRNQPQVQSAFGTSKTVGNFLGQLSNGGERITLLDGTGGLADSVNYRDGGDWSVSPDSLGYSLEKIVPDAISNDPASWNDSGSADGSTGGGWQSVRVSGIATSSRLYVYLRGVGEMLIDNVRLVDQDNPGVNLLQNGDFTDTIAPWTANGNHSTTTWDPEAEALHIKSTGSGTGGSNAARLEILPELDESSDKTYELTFDYFSLSGERSFIARLSVSTASRGVYVVGGGGVSAGNVSPGEANLIRRPTLPPFVGNIGRFPEQPFSDEWVTITARVRGNVDEVELIANLAGSNQTIPMLDDGQSGDGLAGDGVYGADLPPQPNNTAVTFQIVARSPTESRTSPSRTDPEGVHGYYVNENQPDSKIPVWTFIVPSSNPTSYLRGLNCSTYQTASFAANGDLYYNIGLRARGGSVCGATKKYLKIKFNRGHEFQGYRRMNFQSLWTDKALIRERMAWDLFDSMDNPAFYHYFVRMHANAQYYGLHAAYQHPDSDFLSDARLDPTGNLYKADSPRGREEVNGTYDKKTNREISSRADLDDFLETMHATPSSQLVNFFEQRVDEDVMIDYQAANVLVNNRDHPHKNHYLYHDPGSDEWMPIVWDIDLVYGKRWNNGGSGGVYSDIMENPGTTPWYPTSVRGGGNGNHLLDKFFSQAGTYYRRAYLVRLWDALLEKHTTDFYDGEILKFRNLLFEEQADDIAKWGRTSTNDPGSPQDFLGNLERVRTHIQIRHDYLTNYLRTTERFTGHDRLKITELMYNPVGGAEDGEWLELWNNSGDPIDIGRWTIQGIGYEFPLNTDLADGEIIIVAKDPAVFAQRYGNPARVFGPYPGSLDNDGESLRVKDDGPGYPASVDVLRYETDDPWPGRPDGLGFSLELFAVHEDLDNDRASHWRTSSQLGGSPGFVARLGVDVPHFRRGNCNGDQVVDLSDAIAILLYLFQGGTEPPCIDGCDVNGNERVSIDDSIALLNYLFIPSGFNIPSPSPLECGPAREEFCEQSVCVP